MIGSFELEAAEHHAREAGGDDRVSEFGQSSDIAEVLTVDVKSKPALGFTVVSVAGRRRRIDDRVQLPRAGRSGELGRRGDDNRRFVGTVEEIVGQLAVK